uniref:polypeptide N-acetylgalactosaminyltransferase n=1 Tax=Knipowitschia caucasica TaxID=637954 RepID=A0AAV2J848_KNICA
MIDVIDHDSFAYDMQAGGAMRGAFDWEMYYKRIPIPPELQHDDPSEPFESPVMAGGLFAVDRSWFWELGGYDTGLEIWGGEQYEISFKVWMCGGRMEDVPCSRVGHIYRKYVPYKVPGGISLAKSLHRSLSHLIKPLSHLRKPLSHLRKPLSHLRKPLSHLIKPLSHLIKPLSHLRKPLSHLEKPLSHLRKPLSHLRKPLSHLIKPLTHLRKPLSHLEKPGSAVRILFFDFSSAFNTIQPRLPRDKLETVGVDYNLSEWILDYLTDRPQFNLKRVAEVWMDEYAEYIYQRRPEYRHLSAGDMTGQKELRAKLNCKNFRWFMKEVAWDLPKHYPPVEPPAAAWGEIRNVDSGLCMQIKHFVSGSPIRLDACVKSRAEGSWSHGQVLTLGWREDIRVGDPLHTRKVCFDAVSHNSPVTLYDCHGMKGNQLWRYRKDLSLFHPVSSSCIDSSPTERRVFMNTCDPQSQSQHWVFERTNATVLDHFNRDDPH